MGEAIERRLVEPLVTDDVGYFRQRPASRSAQVRNQHGWRLHPHDDPGAASRQPWSGGGNDCLAQGGSAPRGGRQLGTIDDRAKIRGRARVHRHYRRAEWQEANRDRPAPTKCPINDHRSRIGSASARCNRPPNALSEADAGRLLLTSASPAVPSNAPAPSAQLRSRTPAAAAGRHPPHRPLARRTPSGAPRSAAQRTICRTPPRWSP